LLLHAFLHAFLLQALPFHPEKHWHTDVSSQYPLPLHSPSDAFSPPLQEGTEQSSPKYPVLHTHFSVVGSQKPLSPQLFGHTVSWQTDPVRPLKQWHWYVPEAPWRQMPSPEQL